MDIKISSYNSIFELAAGISTALVGLQEIKNFIIKRISAYLTHFQTSLEENALLQETCYNILKKVQTIGKNSPANLKAQETKIDKTKIRSSSYYATTKKENEEKVISNQLKCFLIHNFFYCCVIMVIGGLIDNEFIEKNSGFDFIGTMSILSFFSMIICYYVIHKIRSTGVFLGILSFLSCFGVSFIHLKFDWFGFSSPLICRIWASLFMCAFPFLLVLARIVHWNLLSKTYNKNIAFDNLVLNKVMSDLALASSQPA